MSNYEMKFDPHTIEHLGVKMYSTLPPALAELISNAYDADAESVTLEFLEVGSNKFITVKDDGTGMNSTDIQQRFLVIGRNRRRHDGDEPTPRFGRYATGKKGLGKLALFGLAKEITIDTVKDGKRNRFILDWSALLAADGVYNPIVELADQDTNSGNGTTIKLSKLKRQSSFDLEAIANSLSKIFIVDDTFKITLKDQGNKIETVNNSRRYNGFEKQFEWDITSLINQDSLYNGKLKGRLYTSKTPIRPNSGLRGISIFSRGKLVNNPEFFSNSTSSHFFQYLTGWISADFIDDLKDDVISTNRQSIDWDNEDMAVLRDYLSTIISQVNTDWRNKRKEKKEKELEITTGIDTHQWMNTMPEDIRQQTSKILDFLGNEDALEKYSPVVEALHTIVPEYPMLHWRYLNEKVKDRIKTFYTNRQYGIAADQGTKIYCEIIRSLTGLTIDGTALVNQAFSPEKPLIKICDTSTKTGLSMQNGQMSLSRGVIESFRNPAAHMPLDTLVPDNYSELDCLNILSLISYLLERMEKSEIIKK
ncbi:HSP90 family protein [Serratia quinivorans]|uniref:TIGR02391 family protein n=1 Tax=Serratia quinivorans TaxID=137545 RepID=UPI0021795BFF|nr:TIGR02391 family protein [Serratia quinivorans]CAI1853077.1 HSP90 family protein [Serratia quinivorans]